MPQITTIRLDQLQHKPQERYEIVAIALIGVEHVANIIRISDHDGPGLNRFYSESTVTGEKYGELAEAQWVSFEAAQADLFVQFAAK